MTEVLTHQGSGATLARMPTTENTGENGMESVTTPGKQPSQQPTPPESAGWRIKLLYDGDCPLCMREVNFLRRKDGGRGLVAFVDIASDRYEPAEHGNISFATAMGRIHALLPDGTVIKNVEVFRQVYQILGMGWLYAPTRWPLVGPLVDWAYGIWADWRLRLTGRPDLATLIAQRQGGCSVEGRCGGGSPKLLD